MGCRHCGGVVNGTLGITQSLLRVRVLSQGAIKQRLEICRTCDQSVPCKHNNRQACKCIACGCWLKHKASLRRESCPKNKW